MHLSRYVLKYLLEARRDSMQYFISTCFYRGRIEECKILHVFWVQYVNWLTLYWDSSITLMSRDVQKIYVVHIKVMDAKRVISWYWYQGSTWTSFNCTPIVQSAPSVPSVFITYMIPWASWLVKLRNTLLFISTSQQMKWTMGSGAFSPWIFYSRCKMVHFGLILEYFLFKLYLLCP